MNLPLDSMHVVSMHCLRREHIHRCRAWRQRRHRSEAKVNDRYCGIVDQNEKKTGFAATSVFLWKAQRLFAERNLLPRSCKLVCL
jgi:hypothetical protein